MRAVAAVSAGVGAIGAATALALAGVEPLATWYYVFAWYGTLLAADGWYRLRTGRFFLLGRPAFLATLLAWSVPTWLFFELLNLRLRNWYYVFVPDHPVGRWVGISVSFATVLPAVFLAEASLAAGGIGRGARGPRLEVTPGLRRGLIAAGWLMLGLSLLWPRWFFPLVWGGVTLLLEPINHRRDPSRSLLGDLEAGRYSRLLRLLLAGAVIGFLWEGYNALARGGWIYTVPFFEELKLFEMPVLGFLGFPVFALECFAIWQALVLGGVAVPREGPAPTAPGRRRLGAALAGTAFSAAVLLCIEARTVGSVTPRLADLEVPAEPLRAAGFDVFSLAEAAPSEVAARSGLAPDAALVAVERARLATLRGIGPAHAADLRRAGVERIHDLAAADPAALVTALEDAGAADVVPARVRVWVRGARAEVAGGSP